MKKKLSLTSALVILLSLNIVSQNENSFTIDISDDRPVYETLIINTFNSISKGKSRQKKDSVVFQVGIEKIKKGDDYHTWLYTSKNHKHFFGNGERMREDTFGFSNKVLSTANYLCDENGRFIKFEDWQKVLSDLNLLKDFFQKEEYFQKSTLYELKLLHFLRVQTLSFNEEKEKKSYLLMDAETGGGRLHMPTIANISVSEINKDSTILKIKVAHRIDFQGLYGFPIEPLLENELKNNPELDVEKLKAQYLKEIGIEIFELNLETRQILNIKSEYSIDDGRGSSNYHRYELRKVK